MIAPVSDRPGGATVANFLGAVRRSGVLTRRQCAAVARRVEAGRYPGDAPGLARRLIRKGLLTEYQARRLLHCDRPGLVLGRYAILDRLGEGSMGRVYRARHRLLGHVVALKVIAPEVACRRTAAARFRREMALVGRLDHPNVVRAFDADRDGGVPYIAMEYLAGRTLDEVVRDRGPLPPAEVIGWAAQAARALAHAHGRGVVHRDIKPSNLMVDDSGRLKVLDFGVGSLTDPRADGPDAGLTADGLAVGTVEYMSPEQARGLAADGRSDLYSLGCVIYHLLTGRVPFPATNRVVGLALRIEGRPEPMTDLRPDLPPGLTEVVDRLMAPRPEDRYPGASEAADALTSLLADAAPGAGVA